MTELTDHEIALARSRIYDLLSRLFLRGLRADLLPYVAGIPELAAVLPAAFDTDEAAAEHQALFGFNVFPYQSIFLDPEGLLGGEESARVQASYARAGFDVAFADASPDHMGYELAFLAFLCGAEADALEDDLPETAALMRQHQADFLAAHLLRWLAPFTVAITRQGAPFYAALAEVMQAVVADHAVAVMSAASTQATFTLPATPDLLADPETGLRDIADYLLSPPQSGIYLARADLEGLGRRFDLPRGFGERRQLLLNLLHAAATYELFSELCTHLAALAKDDSRRFDEMEHTSPSAVPWIDPWRNRVQQTVVLLDNLAGESPMMVHAP